MKSDPRTHSPFMDEDVCPACLHPFGPRTAFCSACGAPVGMVANIDPIQHIYSEGYGYRSAADGPPRLIVVIGIWMLFFPLALAGPAVILMGEWSMPAMERVYLMILSAISVVLVYRVTANYLVKSKAAQAAAAATLREDDRGSVRR